MRRPGRPLVVRAAVAVVAAAAVGVLATGTVDPRGWSLAGAVAAGQSAAGQPAAEQVDLGGRPSVLVCPPAPRLGAEVGGDEADEDFRADAPARTATVLRTTGGPALSAAVSPTDDQPPVAVEAQVVGDGAVVETDGREPVAVQAGPETGVGGLALHVADSGDLAGLAASSCGYPAETGWLVGGGVEPGRSGRVVLSNPGATTATVGLVLLTPAGPVSPPAAQDVVVPAGASRDVLLEALVEPTPALAVGVVSRGGEVVAQLVDTRISGVRAQGVEQVPATQPATTLTIPGVLPGAATTTALRVANPGTAPAAVGWRLLGPSGEVVQEGESVLSVAAGAVAEVPLPEVRRRADARRDVLAVVVTADVPVLAAVETRVDRAGGAADRAVVQPAPALGDREVLLPLPADADVTSALALVAADAAALVEVAPLDAEGGAVGDPAQVRVEPGRTVLVAVPEGAVRLRLRPTGSVHAATVLRSAPPRAAPGTFVAVVPVLVPPASPGSIRVSTLSPDVLRAQPTDVGR